MNHFFIALLLLCLALSAKAQNLDSLTSALAQATQDDKINLLNQILAATSCSDSTQFVYYQEVIKKEASLSKYPKENIAYLKNVAYLYYCHNQLNLAISYFDSASTIALKNSLFQDAGRMKNNTASLRKSIGAYEASRIDFKKAIALSKKVNDTLLLIAASSGLGTVHQEQGEIDSALYHFLYAEKICSHFQDTIALLKVKKNINTIYYDYRKELLNEKDLLLQFTISKEIDDVEEQIAALEFLGYFYQLKGDAPKAIAQFEKGLALNKTLNDRLLSILLYKGLSYTYRELGEYKQAITYDNKAVQICQAAQMYSYLPEVYNGLAISSFHIKDYANAAKSGEKGIKLAYELKKYENLHALYKMLAKSYHQLGEHQKAYSAYQHYDSLNQIRMNEGTIKTINELQTKYDTEKKEAAITELSQQTTIQQLAIQQRNQWLAIGGLFILLVGGISYFRTKQKREKDKAVRIELEQRFLRSQLNPHFIFNALDSVQNYVLNGETLIAVQYMSKFAKLMRQVLENSREKYIPLDEEILMLENYMELQKVQPEKEFSYHIEIDDEIDPEFFSIPPMFVQPFVENSIEHGIIHGDGQINIYFRKEGNLVNISVVDNGIGLKTEKVTTTTEKVKAHNSLATSIIKERIESYNEKLKTNIQLLVSEVVNDQKKVLGTKVELKVPFQLG